MRLLTFVLYAALLALIGVLTVHEEVQRVQAGYRTARLVGRRERLRVRLNSLKADLASLKAPERLAQLNDELALGLEPLPAHLPASPDRLAVHRTPAAD